MPCFVLHFGRETHSSTMLYNRLPSSFVMYRLPACTFHSLFVSQPRSIYSARCQRSRHVLSSVRPSERWRWGCLLRDVHAGTCGDCVCFALGTTSCNTMTKRWRRGMRFERGVMRGFTCFQSAARRACTMHGVCTPGTRRYCGTAFRQEYKKMAKYS